MRQPVIFIGHGSPENAYEDNDYTRGWIELAKKLSKPKAILCISAHWLTEGSSVTAVKQPKTIHDFYGFPKPMYQLHYKAPGSPELAKRVKELVKTDEVQLDDKWGLDHGCWVPLSKMFPEADIPVVQLSMDPDQPEEEHYKMGKELSKLRDEDILIIGSGNLVHNLMMADMNAEPFPWAVDFDRFVKEKLEKGDNKALINYTQQSRPLKHIPPTTIIFRYYM